MARNPKFKPQETPLSNYNGGVIAWSYFMLAYADPLGPKVNQYDPYYMYSVKVYMNEEWVPHTWFTTVEDHVRILVAGGTKDTVMKATYVTDQKKRALVLEYQSGPQLARDEAEVRKQVDFAVSQLHNEQSGSSFDQENLINPPTPPAPPPPQAPPSGPPDPFASAPPVVPSGAAGEQPPPLPPEAHAPPAQHTPPPQQSTPTPPPPVADVRAYRPLNDDEKAAWQAQFSDIAELQLFAYATILEKGKELGVKIKPSDQRELATSASIQTWREFGKKGGLYGWTYLEPLSASTKNGALQKMEAYSQELFADKAGFIKSWLGDVAEPVDGLGTWKHAANIAKLLGVDSQVVFDDFEVDTMMLLAQAIWVYQGSRDEGMSRNESLSFVAEEYGLPEETMQFEEEDE